MISLTGSCPFGRLEVVINQIPKSEANCWSTRDIGEVDALNTGQHGQHFWEICTYSSRRRSASSGSRRSQTNLTTLKGLWEQLSSVLRCNERSENNSSPPLNLMHISISSKEMSEWFMMKLLRHQFSAIWFAVFRTCGCVLWRTWKRSLNLPRQNLVILTWFRHSYWKKSWINCCHSSSYCAINRSLLRHSLYLRKERL